MAKLESFTIKNFSKGYNSFGRSRTMIEDEEFPQGAVNVVLDDNGSVSKVAGSSRYSPAEIAPGKAIRGIAQFRTASINKCIVAAGDTWYDVNPTASSALTGVIFTDDLETFFCQAMGRLYGCNGVNNLAYTGDGASITSVSTNGNVGDQIVYFNQRLYMTNASNPDRLYYSNPYNQDGTIGNFGTFDTDLSANPPKNAGFLALDPGSGEEIIRLEVEKNFLYVYTRRNVWRISAMRELNDDNSIAHIIEVLVASNGTPSRRGVTKVGNDIWHYNYDNIYSLGEVANFQNIRATTKSARVKSEIDTISTAGRSRVAAVTFGDSVYFAYSTGAENNKIIVYDVRLNAWGSPILGKNIGCFLDWEDSDGTRRLLGGSSDPDKSYIYELFTGTDDDNAAISAQFETKSVDCNFPGLVKRFAFAEVFYSMVYGKLSYEVKIDETISTTGARQLGNSTDRPVGIGSMLLGSFPIGAEYDSNIEFAYLAQNSSFTIDTGFEDGKRISIKFSNNNLGEQFKINAIKFWYKKGSPHESIT